MKLLFASALTGMTLLALAKPMAPGHIPGDRLVANLTARLQKEPNNPAIYYLIGRAHYAIFSRAVESSWSKMGEVEVFQREPGLPSLSSISGNIYPWDSKTAVKDTPTNRRHVTEAIRNLRKALDLADHPINSQQPTTDVALAHLTLGCVFECGALLAPNITLADPYKTLTKTNQWRLAAASEYLLAYEGSISVDSKEATEPMFGLQTLVAYESGESFLRICPSSKESKSVRDGVSKLKSLPPPNAITPLVLDLTQRKNLDDLLQPATKVNFDLDGSGRVQTYDWVKPTTAFLVWDPEHEGKITSGRQLFGNATWWMLWDNAYAALDALDDNRDGWLSGKELRGLALWYDRNGNGKSDPGEVIPIEQAQITALNTHSDGRDGLSFSSSEGLKLKDGRVLPTYDWVTKTTK